MGMIAWTIYDHPRDFPDKFVARQFYIFGGVVRPSDRAFFADSLEELRARIHWLYPDLMPFQRNEHDEPQIVETWI